MSQRGISYEFTMWVYFMNVRTCTTSKSEKWINRTNLQKLAGTLDKQYNTEEISCLLTQDVKLSCTGYIRA